MKPTENQFWQHECDQSSIEDAEYPTHWEAMNGWLRWFLNSSEDDERHDGSLSDIDGTTYDVFLMQEYIIENDQEREEALDCSMINDPDLEDEIDNAKEFPIKFWYSIKRVQYLVEVGETKTRLHPATHQPIGGSINILFTKVKK